MLPKLPSMHERLHFFYCLPYPIRVSFAVHIWINPGILFCKAPSGVRRGTRWITRFKTSRGIARLRAREFAPGEWYYSAVIAEGDELKRFDYAAEVWQGPPENAVGWWKSQVPDKTSRRKHWAPNDVMLNFFDELAASPDKQDMRYVLTLLLVRRRVFRLEEEERDAEGREGADRLLPPPRRDVHRAGRDAGAGTDRTNPGGIGGAAAIEMTNVKIE